MKRIIWLQIFAATTMLATTALGQQLRQPKSVRHVGFNRFAVLQEVETSPSDLPIQPGKPPMEDYDAVSADDDDGGGYEANSSTAPEKKVSSCGLNSCGADCNSCSSGCDNACCEPWKLFPDDNCWGITFGGWIQGGYHSESNGLFNSHPDMFNLHQLWLYAEKEADGRCGWDWGFRFDAVYGVDAQDTQAFGNNPGRWDYLNGYDHGIYGWALPQLYGELASGDLSIKFGHFFTLVGYEVVTAPDNFFYSHAFTQYNSEPFTHTGVLGTYSLCDDVEIYAGWTLGWDTGFDQLGDGSNFLGGIKLALSDSLNMTYITTAGDMGDWALGGRGDGYTHSMVFDYSVCDNLNYVLQSDLVSLNTGGVSRNDEYGLNQYLIYTINDCWSYGSRLEWWKSDSGFDFDGQAAVPGGSISYYEYTSGLNYKPTANLTLRPEVRHDWSPAANYDETTFGVDVIVTF